MCNYLNSMTNRAFAVVLTLLFTVTFLVTLFMMAGAQAHGASPSTTAAAPAPAWAWRKNWDACASDEQQPGARCVWHAVTMGNGTGNSYIQTRKGHVIYITHRDAARLLRPTYAL